MKWTCITVGRGPLGMYWARGEHEIVEEHGEIRFHVPCEVLVEALQARGYTVTKPELAAEPPALDGDGYPTEGAIHRIAAWPITRRADVRALIEFVRELWEPHGYFGVTEEKDAPPTWHLSTYGWSGNESIVEALQRNSMFWFVCWKSSARGGHYEFQASGVEFPDDPKPSTEGAKSP